MKLVSSYLFVSVAAGLSLLPFVFCSTSLNAQEKNLATTRAQSSPTIAPPPRINHILVEVKDMNASVAFYRDPLGLRVKSQKSDFTILESGNVGVFLSSGHWDWDETRPESARPGWSMYPHWDVTDVSAVIERARKAGYKIPQEPRKYDWGIEAFVADPDGYVWALVSAPKK